MQGRRRGSCRHDTRRAWLRRCRNCLCEFDTRLEARRARPKPATPAPIAPSPAASSCIPRATSRRARRPTSSISRAIADHPTNRGTLCPKGAALLDIRPRRRRACIYPMIRKPGSDKFERVSWDVRARPHRAADEGRSRQELHRQERRRGDGQPLDLARASSPLRRPPTKRRGRPTRSSAAPGCWHSIIKRASDTDLRCPVWAQRSVAAR